MMEETKNEDLEILLQSDNYRNWLAVASSPLAQKKHLLAVAKLVPRMDKGAGFTGLDRRFSQELFNRWWARDEVMRALYANPVTDDDIAYELCAIEEAYTCWTELARQPCAGKQTINCLAEKCLHIYRSDFCAKALAQAITERQDIDEEPLLILCDAYYWFILILVAKAPMAGEKTLDKLAAYILALPSYSFGHDIYKIIESIVDHPNCSVEIKRKLLTANDDHAVEIVSKRLQAVAV